MDPQNYPHLENNLDDVLQLKYLQLLSSISFVHFDVYVARLIRMNRVSRRIFMLLSDSLMLSKAVVIQFQSTHKLKIISAFIQIF